jgi:hypothetical protein
MGASTILAPSPEARRLFGMMVARADEDLHLTLAQALELSCSLMRSGEDHEAHGEISSLIQAEWIDPAPDGGWLLH